MASAIWRCNSEDYRKCHNRSRACQFYQQPTHAWATDWTNIEIMFESLSLPASFCFSPPSSNARKNMKCATWTACMYTGQVRAPSLSVTKDSNADLRWFCSCAWSLRTRVRVSKNLHAWLAAKVVVHPYELGQRAKLRLAVSSFRWEYKLTTWLNSCFPK